MVSGHRPTLPGAHSTEECFLVPTYHRICETCGQSFTAWRGDDQQPPRFCSHACRQTQVEIICPRCGKVFRIKHSHAATRVYCSRACAHPRRPEITKVCIQCGQPFTRPDWAVWR